MNTETDCCAAGTFLADYAAWMMGCGATCARIERNVARMARAFGISANLTIMPRHVTLSVADSAGASPLVYVGEKAPCGINFEVNTRLSALSWSVVDDKLSLCEAQRKFHEITSRRHSDTGTILLLASLANASFCRLFGGDAVAMLVVFAATIIGMGVKTLMLRSQVDVRVTFIVAAFVSAVICAGSVLFHWGDTPEIAVATSVLYLVPGVPYINSASDLIAGHYLCFISRFVDACVLTGCLTLGLVGGMAVIGIEKFI